MSEGTWAKPLHTGRWITGAVVAMIHAVLFMTYRPQHAQVPGNAFERNSTIFLVPLRLAPLAVGSENSNKPSRSPTKKKRPMAARLPKYDAIPDAAPAHVDVGTIGKTVDVDPDWTASHPAKPAPVTDIRARSLFIAGKVDAHVRQGVPAPLHPDDTPFRRLQNKMAEAAQGGGNSTTIAVSPSGEPITIITRNGKPHCYVPVSTSVAPSAVFNNRGSERATQIRCPEGLR